MPKWHFWGAYSWSYSDSMANHIFLFFHTFHHLGAGNMIEIINKYWWRNFHKIAETVYHQSDLSGS